MSWTRLLSVDPGAHTAWALWERSGSTCRLARWGRMRAPDVRGAMDALAELGDWQGQLVVVEGQFYVDHDIARRRGYQSSPWSDVARLIELRCWWVAAAGLLGAETEVVRPGLWIRAMTRGMRGPTKERIRRACEQRLPGPRLVRDEYDAVLLGVWAIEEAGLRPAWREEAA